MYNPKLDIFNTLQKFDRPMTCTQLRKAVPAIPPGTVSSTLSFFEKEKLVVREPTDGRADSYRLVVQKPPDEFMVSRLNAPVKRGLTRDRAKKPYAESLLTVPLPNRDAITVTKDEAISILRSIKAFIGDR